jgi:hypothetical protein
MGIGIGIELLPGPQGLDPDPDPVPGFSKPSGTDFRASQLVRIERAEAFDQPAGFDRQLRRRRLRERGADLAIEIDQALGGREGRPALVVAGARLSQQLVEQAQLRVLDLDLMGSSPREVLDSRRTPRNGRTSFRARSNQSGARRAIEGPPAAGLREGSVMFWKVIVAMLAVYGVAFYMGFMLGGLIHILPVAAVIAVGGRRMGKAPNSEYGRWRSAAERYKRDR